LRSPHNLFQVFNHNPLKKNIGITSGWWNRKC